MFRLSKRPIHSSLARCCSGPILNQAQLRSTTNTGHSSRTHLQQHAPPKETEPKESTADIITVLRQLQAENRVQTGDEDFPECSPVWFNKSVSAIDHRFCTLPTHTKKLFSDFIQNDHSNIAVVPGSRGCGRTTLLQMLSTCLVEDARIKSLYLSDAIAYDATDPRLSFGDSSFIKLQYRVLHAATGAPPHAFGRTVLELRRRLGLEAWFAFPNDVLFEAVRKALTINAHLLIAVDDVHAPGQPQHSPHCLDVSDSHKQCPDATNTSIEDLHRLYHCPHGQNILFIGATTSQSWQQTNGYMYLLTTSLPNPHPRIEAASLFLHLDPHSQRAYEVQYMLRHAAVHARFLADTYHQICGGGLTSVADFDAKFNAFVGPRIDQFLAYCREKHLDPNRLFDVIFLARPGSSIIDPLTVAADALGLCTIVSSPSLNEPETDIDPEELPTLQLSGPQSPSCAHIWIHPRVFEVLHSAIYRRTKFIYEAERVMIPSATSTLHLVLTAFARRVNAFSALTTEAVQSSAARCPLHFQSDVALLMLIAILARAVDDASHCFGHTLADLPLGWNDPFMEEALKDAMVRRMDPAHTSYAAMLASHTLAQGDGPLLVEGMPRAVYSFPRFDDGCGLLSDPSAAPALLRSMAAHGLIRGALHGLDVRWDINRQIRGSLTLGLQAIDTLSAERTEVAIAEHRARRAEWATAFASTSEKGENASSPQTDLLGTNMFVHVFVVDVNGDSRLQYTAKAFTVGDITCFEVVISLAELHRQWPLAARITTLDGTDRSDNTSNLMK